MPKGMFFDCVAHAVIHVFFGTVADPEYFEPVLSGDPGRGAEGWGADEIGVKALHLSSCQAFCEKLEKICIFRVPFPPNQTGYD